MVSEAIWVKFIRMDIMQKCGNVFNSFFTLVFREGLKKQRKVTVDVHGFNLTNSTFSVKVLKVK